MATTLNFKSGIGLPQWRIVNYLPAVPSANLSSHITCDLRNNSYSDPYAYIANATNLIYYYKRRGGVGVDISTLRPNGTTTNNTAKSSTGAIS